jgi:hypothetical protein
MWNWYPLCNLVRLSATTCHWSVTKVTWPSAFQILISDCVTIIHSWIMLFFSDDLHFFSPHINVPGRARLNPVNVSPMVSASVKSELSVQSVRVINSYSILSRPPKRIVELKNSPRLDFREASGSANQTLTFSPDRQDNLTMKFHWDHPRKSAKYAFRINIPLRDCQKRASYLSLCRSRVFSKSRRFWLALASLAPAWASRSLGPARSMLYYHGVLVKLLQK